MMRSALSLVLVVSFATSTLPLAAQEKMDPTPGPLARSMTREVARLAAESTASGVEGVQQNGVLAAESNWSRVRKLSPGAEVIVTAAGFQPGKRIVVAADDSNLTVLNVTDPALPRAARSVLLDTASNRPEHFGEAQHGGTFLLDKNVRLESGGVFIGDQKVADLGQVVERIARTDVVEVRRESAPGHPVRTGALIGLGVGAFVGFLGAAYCHRNCEYQVFGIPVYAGIGAGIGAGAGAANGPSSQVIYRAP